MLAYKVLTEDLRGPYQNRFQYELGKEYVCEDFDPDVENDCSRGFYATETIEGFLYCNLNHRKKAFLCEVDGRTVNAGWAKQRWEKIKIIKELPESEIRVLAKALEPDLDYKLEDALYPVNPFKIKPPEKITEEHIELLQRWGSVGASASWGSVWASVRDSVGASVWDSVRRSVFDSVWASVWASVWDSVGASVWASVWDSVWASVWDSVCAYISSLFPNITAWEFVQHEKGANPFQPGIDLWHLGLVPSYDGDVWRLHGGATANILWEGSLG